MFDPRRIEKGLWWDRAWTLVEGCTKVSLACHNCWAERQADIRMHQKNEKLRRRYDGLLDENGHWTGRIKLMQENLQIPLRTGKPTVFAVWNDLFHEDVPTVFIEQALTIMALQERHFFLILTKRIERAKKIIARAVPNIWLGVTAENQEQADRRIPPLLQIPAAKRFVSIEPMLGPVDLTKIRHPRGAVSCFDVFTSIHTPLQGEPHKEKEFGTLDWVILGGETGKNARPMHPGWVRSMLDQCNDAGIAFFFKGWGEWKHCSICSPKETYYPHTQNGSGIFFRVSKKKTSRFLDGREWSEVP